MTRTLWFRWLTCLLVALSIAVSGGETKGKGKAAKAADKEAADVAAKVAKPVAAPEDVDAFRKRDDPEAVEIVVLHDEIDKAYTELRTAMNVAQGDDKEARKAKGEIKALEAKIKRQSRKLEAAVEKFALPIDRDYKATKRKFEGLQEKAKQYEEQKQEKKATATFQQADRYTGQMEAAKRTLDAVHSLLTFESAEGLDLGRDTDDSRIGKGSKSTRIGMGGKERE